MDAPAIATQLEKTQRIHLRLGTQKVMVVKVACATMAIAAWGVAIKTVFALEKPYPEMINGLNCVMPALVMACAMKNVAMHQYFGSLSASRICPHSIRFAFLISTVQTAH